MHDILIALGSNVHSDNIKFVESCLVQDFYEVQSTAIVATDPIGAEFQGKLFYNAVVSCHTNLDKDDVVDCLKYIEHIAGNTKQKRKEGIVVIDIDLLKFDNEILHEKDWQRQYIKELTKPFIID